MSLRILFSKSTDPIGPSIRRTIRMWIDNQPSGLHVLAAPSLTAKRTASGQHGTFRVQHNRNVAAMRWRGLLGGMELPATIKT